MALELKNHNQIVWNKIFIIIFVYILNLDILH